jgi:putative transposase
MTNHVHLLATPLHEDSIGKMQQMIGRYYVPYFNKRYHRTGTLWEGRYKATLVETKSYFLTCMRYIELNPVRAKMVESPAYYPWSSYHANALGALNTIIHFHDEYLALGNTNEIRKNAYQQLFEVPISQKQISDIREATNKAWVLSEESYETNFEQMIGRQAKALAKGGDRRSGRFINHFNRV